MRLDGDTVLDSSPSLRLGRSESRVSSASSKSYGYVIVPDSDTNQSHSAPPPPPVSYQCIPYRNWTISGDEPVIALTMINPRRIMLESIGDLASGTVFVHSDPKEGFSDVHVQVVAHHDSLAMLDLASVCHGRTNDGTVAVKLVVSRFTQLRYSVLSSTAELQSSDLSNKHLAKPIDFTLTLGLPRAPSSQKDDSKRPTLDLYTNMQRFQHTFGNLNTPFHLNHVSVHTTERTVTFAVCVTPSCPMFWCSPSFRTYK